MELSWFKQPAEDDPGSLNLCFNALDRHVVHGRAEAVALVAGDVRVDFATLTERAASLGGALRSLGVGRGTPVATELPHLGCRKLMARFGADALRWVNARAARDERRRGLYARVVTAGTIRVGDRAVVSRA